MISRDRNIGYNSYFVTYDRNMAALSQSRIEEELSKVQQELEEIKREIIAVEDDTVKRSRSDVGRANALMSST